MNVYWWQHLDSEGCVKDGPFQIYARNATRARELIAGRIRGMTFSEGDQTFLKLVGESDCGSEYVLSGSENWD